MFELELIKPGMSLTLKSSMAGYYQVRVKDVGNIRKQGYSSTVAITIDAWRYYKDEPWNLHETTIVISASDSVSINEN